MPPITGLTFMTTGKTTSRLLTLLFLLPLTLQAGSFTLPQLMGLFSGVQSRSASYTEEQTLAVLDVPLESHGTLTFRAPDILEKSVANGGGSYRVEGQQLQVEQGGVQRQIALDSYPALAAFVASFRATLAGDQQTLERYYTVRLEGGQTDWTLTLVPTQSDMAAVIKRITIHGSGNQIDLIETAEQSGDSSRMQLRENNEN
jgi:hypothetical protein